jgi:hypothetical protein
MSKQPWTPDERSRHWDSSYAERGAHGVSWHQPRPSVALELIGAFGISRDAAVIDVGGGASLLVDGLIEQGFLDVTVLDVSEVALAETQRRLGDSASVELLHEDVLVWQPLRRYAVWHDRAVFHFLVASDERDAYLKTMRSALAVGSHVVLATFAPHGPETCSGLPVARYSASDLADLLGPPFELLDARREEHRTPQGAVQPFTWVAGRMSPA